MRCIERLEMPVYPRLASGTRTTGKVTARVTLAKNGKPTLALEEESSTKLKQLFASAIDKAIGDSKFSSSCEDKTVIIVFTFVMEGLDDSKAPQQSVSFTYPNQFRISMRNRLINVAWNSPLPSRRRL